MFALIVIKQADYVQSELRILLDFPNQIGAGVSGAHNEHRPSLAAEAPVALGMP